MCYSEILIMRFNVKDWCTYLEKLSEIGLCIYLAIFSFKVALCKILSLKKFLTLYNIYTKTGFFSLTYMSCSFGFV